MSEGLVFVFFGIATYFLVVVVLELLLEVWFLVFFELLLPVLLLLFDMFVAVPFWPVPIPPLFKTDSDPPPTMLPSRFWLELL